jgi:hypothetical protein
MGWVRGVVFCLTIVLFAGQAAAQTPYANYPNRPIKIISGSLAGGGVDLSTRIVADQLQKLWGQPVTVEDRTGGSSNIAGEAVARSEPDGYTLFATPPSTITANAVLFRHLNYDPAALSAQIENTRAHNGVGASAEAIKKMAAQNQPAAAASPLLIGIILQATGGFVGVFVVLSLAIVISAGCMLKLALEGY